MMSTSLHTYCYNCFVRNNYNNSGGVMIDINTFINISYYDQWLDTKNKKWAGKTCAICCLKMFLVFKNNKNSKLKIMDLVKTGVRLGGYNKAVGWDHKTITELAQKYEIRMSYRKKFYYTKKEKLKGLAFINKNITKGKPIMASIWNKKRTGGHMVVVNGLRKKDELVNGYFVLDPDSRGKTGYYLNKKDFLNLWRGGLLWLLDN